MKLLDIVETKFLPPNCKKQFGAGHEPFYFIVKEIKGLFFPIIQDLNYGKNSTFFFQNGKRSAIRNHDKINQPNNGALKFNSLEEATRACWEYYRKKDYCLPAYGTKQ